MKDRNMIQDLDELVTSGVNLFSTMLGMPMRQAPLDPGAANCEPHVAGAVGFIGRLTGVVLLKPLVATQT